jgi:(2Fe-2S) ferredoxin
VKNDLPLALERVRAGFPMVRFSVACALGVDPALGELMHERAAIDPDDAAKTAVVVVGRGASDPDANGDFCKLVRLYAEGRGLSQVVPTFIGITRPLVDESLELVARARPGRVRILPYLLFGGRLQARLEQVAQAFRAYHPWIPTEVAPPLGTDERIFALMDRRLSDALEPKGGGAPLPCDTCQYRTPLPGRQEQVGGLKALLFSLRHGFTHTQAVPHVHAHKPVKKHVLVCANADCAERGSIALLEALRRAAKDAGRAQDIRVTRTSCIGRCGEGPTVVVYPDGIWYRGVTANDAQELFDEHLLSDRLVARLVDNIMQ